MASMVTKLTRGNLCLVTEAQGATSNAEAWKKIIGDKPVSPRLQTLPEPRPRWSALLTSTIFQVLLAGLLIVLPAVFPDKLASKSYEVVPIVAPETEIALPAEQPLAHPNVIATPPPLPLPAEEPPQPPIAAKLIAPKALVPPKPKPAPADTVDVPALNEISAGAKFEAPPSEPAKPREPVKTGTLAAGGGGASDGHGNDRQDCRTGSNRRIWRSRRRTGRHQPHCAREYRPRRFPRPAGRPRIR